MTHKSTEHDHVPSGRLSTSSSARLLPGGVRRSVRPCAAAAASSGRPSSVITCGCHFTPSSNPKVVNAGGACQCVHFHRLPHSQELHSAVYLDKESGRGACRHGLCREAVLAQLQGSDGIGGRQLQLQLRIARHLIKQHHRSPSSSVRPTLWPACWT